MIFARGEMNFTMHDPQRQLLQELEWGCDQRGVAMTYAFIMRQEPNADWPKINAAIRERWKGKNALARVKEMAWKFAEGKEI